MSFSEDDQHPLDNQDGLAEGVPSEGDSPLPPPVAKPVKKELPPPPPPPSINKAQLKYLETLADHYQQPAPQEGLNLLQVGVFLLLQRGVSAAGTRESLERIQKSTVDWNEVRVSSIAEFVDWCAPAKSADLVARCETVLLFLSNVYRDHNDVNLDILLKMTREERQKYLPGLEPLEPWMIHYLLNAAENYLDLIFQNDMNRVLQRLGLIKREGSPRKAVEATRNLFGGHPRTLEFQSALVQHGTEVCVSAIRVNLCRGCLFAKNCPSTKA